MTVWQRRLLLDRFGAPSTSLENPAACLIRTLGRTNNRIRSPRLAASSRWNNVVKGSRQNGSVTSGKGLALRVGPLGVSVLQLRLLGGTASRDADPPGGPSSRVTENTTAMNNRLRTGADKGNPTVSRACCVLLLRVVCS